MLDWEDQKSSVSKGKAEVQLRGSTVTEQKCIFGYFGTTLCKLVILLWYRGKFHYFIASFSKKPFHDRKERNCSVIGIPGLGMPVTLKLLNIFHKIIILQFCLTVKNNLKFKLLQFCFRLCFYKNSSSFSISLTSSKITDSRNCF